MNTPPEHKLTLFDILFMPFGCLITASPMVLGIVLALVGLTGAYLYYSVNMDFFGLGNPDYKSLQFDGSFSRVSGPDGLSWVIEYEKPNDSIFSGVVRNASPIRLGQIPFLTHDILVTSGDFSDPKLVSTSVSNHHFSWHWSNNGTPKGTINLIHAVPASEELYRQLLKLRDWQTVSLRGHEILRINAFDKSGQLMGGWEDSGCNSMLVTGVEIN